MGLSTFMVFNHVPKCEINKIDEGMGSIIITILSLLIMVVINGRISQ